MRDQADVDRLLARGYTGGPGHDRILDEVLRRTAEPQPARGKRLWPALIAAATVCSGLLLWIVAVRPGPDAIRPKGVPSTSAAVIDLRCGSEGLRVCHHGDTLMFEVATVPTTRYLAACAERELDPTHDRIWYFPTSGGMTPIVAAGAPRAILPKGIMIGDDHPPGRYRAVVWLSSRPLARRELESGSAPSGVTLERTILEFEVSDQPRRSP
jgi:hypothetical protein